MEQPIYFINYKKGMWKNSIEFFHIPLFAFVVYKLLESYAEKVHFPYPIEILFFESMRQFYFSSFYSDIYIDYVLLPQVKLLV